MPDFGCLRRNLCATSALQFLRPNNAEGLNVYETGKADTVLFEGIKVRIGGDFAMQFQAIDHSNDLGNLVELASDFNLSERQP